MMFTRFKSIQAVLWIFFLTLSGCGQENQVSHLQLGVPFKAQVLKFRPLEPNQKPSAVPHHHFETATFNYLQSLDPMRGSYYDILSGGRLTIQTKGGIQSLSSVFEGGKSPVLNYIVKQDTIVPQDYDTLVVLSSLYHLDSILERLEFLTGISADTFISRSGLIHVLYEPAIHMDDQLASSDVIHKSNAAFDPSSYQILLYRRSQQEDVPVSSNLQVMSHEFGHAVWQYIFSTSLGDPFFDSLEMKGMNEGFADFFSYSLTGSTNIIGSSMRSVARRSEVDRNFSAIKFDYQGLFNDAVRAGRAGTDAWGAVREPVCMQGHYCLGTLFAKSLFETQEALGLNPSSDIHRARMLKSLIKSMIKAKPTMIFKQTPEHPLGVFFSSILAQIEDQNFKSLLCSKLIKNFGDRGFPFNFRVGCWN